MPALDMAAWLLMTLAFVYCAVKIVKTPNDEWDLPPLGQGRGPSACNNLGRDHKTVGRIVPHESRHGPPHRLRQPQLTP